MDNPNQQGAYRPQHQQREQQPTVQTTGAKPRTLHVAHRRSPSELTTLMCTYHIPRIIYSQFSTY